jgi:hypothetical protein
VYLAWYGTVGQDLRLGVWGDVQDLQVAAPSPTPRPMLPPPAEGCGDDGVVALDLIAASIAFDTDCLVAPASEKFTIDFDNQDDGVHNLDVFTEQGGDSLADRPKTGPAKSLDVDPLDVGTYYFQCDVHPTTMFGALAVVKGAK